MANTNELKSFLEKAEEKGKSMVRGKTDKEIVSFHYNDHDYTVFLVDNICLRSKRYKVVRDNNEVKYVKHLTMDIFETF